jgi:predicted nuclease of predicted toxin-antitoxin system
LIDRCAGRRLADWLRDQGHDVVESREREPDPGDRILLGWAASQLRILVTMDKDFGQIIFVENAPHCGLVRLPDVPAARRIELMERLLREEYADRLKGELAVLQELGGWRDLKMVLRYARLAPEHLAPYQATAASPNHKM